LPPLRSNKIGTPSRRRWRLLAQSLTPLVYGVEISCQRQGDHIMTDINSIMLFAQLSGFRILVLADRLGCESEFSRELHDRLIEGLEAAIDRLHAIMSLERQLTAGDDEYAAYHLAAEWEIFSRFTIELLDDIDIDHDTHEYRVNGGRWATALSVDETGVYVDYPAMASLTENELGSLAPIIRDIVWETGIGVRARRAVDGQTRFLHPNYAVHSDGSPAT
jgi:hypothetical protein